MCINRFESFHSNGLNYLKWDQAQRSFSNEIKSLDTRKVCAVFTKPKIVYRKYQPVRNAISCTQTNSQSNNNNQKKHENICNQSTKMRILLLFFSCSVCVCLGLCVIVNLSSCSSEIEPKMIFREHHLIIKGSFAFEVHDRFMSKDAFRRRPKTQPNRERARETERASERVSEQDRKSPRVLLVLANQMCVKWHSLTTPMTLI